MPNPNAPLTFTTPLLRLCNLYFTVIEPLAALGGVVNCLALPQRFITATISPTHTHLTDVEKALVAQLGSSYALFAILGALLLRNSRDGGVWRNVAIGCILSDVGHIYGATIVQGVWHVVSCWLWSAEDWVNFGTLYLGLGLRLAFVLVTASAQGDGEKARKTI